MQAPSRPLNLGLPLDARARVALDRLRSEGRRLVKLARLATAGSTGKRDGSRRPPREERLLYLFKLACLTALRAEEATRRLLLRCCPGLEQ
jgi:hypothetical protein